MITDEAVAQISNGTTSDAGAHPVNSFTEWDLLEEVIVGVMDHACWPPWHPTLAATMPETHHHLFQTLGGTKIDSEHVGKANRELEEFVRILEAEGVRVRRPERVDHSRSFSTQEWESASGLYGAMPRDLLLVVGDELIEVPMAWRCRYLEVHAYRTLLKEYFKNGARWTSAPRPMLSNELYNDQYDGDTAGPSYVITEFEPTFDAADFVRFGGDIFVQRSNVTNEFGISWLRRHLGPKYRIRELSVRDKHPMHLDATIMPLAPGKLLANPERFVEVPRCLAHWEVLYAPPPCIPDTFPLYMSSNWLSMNVLSLDEKRVIVEAGEVTTIAFLKKHGFQPIPVPFKFFNAFGGSFHCATLDVRRKGNFAYYCDDI